MSELFSFQEQDLLYRLALAAAGLVIVFVLVRVSIRLLTRRIDDPDRVYRISRQIRRTGAVVMLGLLLVIFSPRPAELVAILTVVGAGLAIALREALLSVAGWLRIVLVHPYQQGDRIEINGVRGDVIDIRVMRTTLMEIGGWVDADQSTGRLVHIPNAWVFLYPVYNYTQGFRFIWNELSVTVTFRSDWQAARDIMESLARESTAIVERQVAEEIRQMSREFLVHYSILTPFVYVRIVENGIRLTLRYLCEARKRRGTEHALTVSILEAFRRHGGIELAYPAVQVALPDTPQFGPLPPTDHDASGTRPPDRPHGA